MKQDGETADDPFAKIEAALLGSALKSADALSRVLGGDDGPLSPEIRERLSIGLKAIQACLLWYHAKGSGETLSRGALWRFAESVDPVRPDVAAKIRALVERFDELDRFSHVSRSETVSFSDLVERFDELDRFSDPPPD